MTFTAINPAPAEVIAKYPANSPEAMEAALASAAKKRYPDEDPDIRVSIDRDSGDYEHEPLD